MQIQRKKIYKMKYYKKKKNIIQRKKLRYIIIRKYMIKGNFLNIKKNIDILLYLINYL